MKKITNIYILLLVVTIFSCDSLELEPINSIDSGSFYTSAENLNAGLFGIYDALQLNGIYGEQLLLDGLSDNCIVDQTFTPDIASLAAGKQVEVSASFINMYQDPYVLIQRANLLLDNADEINGVTNTDLAIIKAEATALRAMAYMKLVYLFGDVPFMTSALTRDEVLQIARTDRNTVIEFVLSEFSDAASVLNTTSSNGRITKQAVLGLHAKVMLYEARLGNQTWGNAQSSIDEAINTANTAGHSLIDTDNPNNDYKSIFTEAGEGNSEFIFSVKNSSIDLSDSYNEEFSWQAGRLNMYIHQSFADAYGYADGSAYNPEDDSYIGRDPRLSVNIMHEGLTFNGITYNGTDEGGFVGANSPGTATNLFLYKFVTTDFSASFNEGTLDIPVLRYADLLLMQAEATNETDGNGHGPLNLVRDRAGLPAISGLSKSELRAEILKERRLELPFEGQRWFDLVTSGIAENVINAIVEENVTIERGFTTNRNELLPIPQIEIEANANITQNPGY